MFELGYDRVPRSFADRPYETGVNRRVLLQDGYPRRFVVWVPESAARTMAGGGQVPLVVMLHGSSGSGEQFLRISGWREKAEAEGFVAAFPTGLVYLVTDRPHPRHNTKWSSYDLVDDIDPDDRPRGYPPAPAPFPADDVAFLRDLARDIQAGLAIDERRTYIAGFSSGGEMCARIAVEASDVFAAAACNAGGLDTVRPTLAGHPNAPLLLAVGSLDDRVIARMQAVDPTVTEVPLDPAELEASPAISTVVRDLLCSVGLDDTPVARVLRFPRSTELHWETPLPGNEDGNELVFEVLAGVTHEYPNGRNNPAGFVMADRAWEFFRRRELASNASKGVTCLEAS
jgi:dienelactone hydrolase